MKAILAACYLSTVALLSATPWLTPRDILFGVRIAPEFRATPTARHAIRIFHLYMLAAALAGLAIIVCASPVIVIAAPPVIAAAIFAIAFIRLRSHLRPLAQSVVPVTPEPVRQEMDLRESDRMPRTKWISLIAVAMVCATGIYLHQNWDRIPERFPIHWSANGQPNGWAMRTPKGVYGILIFMGCWLLWLLMLNAVLWYGVRRSQYRSVVFNVVAIAQIGLAAAASSAGLIPLFKPSPLVVLASIFSPVAGALLYALNANPAMPETGSVSPNVAGGLFYFNRQDPAIGVPKISSLGFTPNWARPSIWIVLLMPLLITFAGLHWLL